MPRVQAGTLSGGARGVGYVVSTSSKLTAMGIWKSTGHPLRTLVFQRFVKRVRPGSAEVRMHEWDDNQLS
jgi:hypothetical protein